MKYLLFFTFIFSTVSIASDEIPVPHWNKLLRYKSSIFGTTSEVDSKNFFLAENGKHSPIDEWKATLKAFKKPWNKSKADYHPICQFPARYNLIKQYTNEKFEHSPKECPQYQKFINKVDINGVSLVFSSYYINRPASTFGHTFFRLHSNHNKTGNDLLDYGVDFAASVDTGNALIYGVKGILGGFKGVYSMMPYFLKIREYNDYESRDLWEYKLKLNNEELDLFMAHLWEMNLAYFDYYYFTENCSYHILNILDAINPDWNLMKEVPYFTVPVDTLFALNTQKGIITDTKMRPSAHRLITKRRDSLSNKESKIFKTALDNSELPSTEELSPQASAKLHDALIDFIDYKYPKEFLLSKDKSKIKKFKSDLLEKRSTLPDAVQITDFPEASDPLEGHFSRKVQGGYDPDSNDIFLNYRFTFHHISEYDRGRQDNVTLEMGDLQVIYRDNIDKFLIETFDIVEVTAFREFELIEKNMSWDFKMGLKRVYNGPNSKLRPNIEFGYGLTTRLPRTIIGLLAHSRYSPSKTIYHSGHGLELGLKLMTKFKLTEKLGLYIAGSQYKRIDGLERNIYEIDGRLNLLLGKSLELSARYMNQKTIDQNIFLSAGYFF